jgi:tRNA nucleotidyltransferase (CCA-adding enzyme)
MHPDSIKLLLKISKPSEILNYLRYTRKLDPEIEALITTPQDNNNHPEGSAYIHTCLVIDEAAEISVRQNLSEFDNAVLRLAALTHDFGKATHTQIQPNGKITSYGHAEAGILPATYFLQRSKVNEFVIQQVLPLVNLHMAWVGFYTPDITSKAVRKILRKLRPATFDMLAYVVEADMSGRGGKYFKQGLPQRMKDILAVAATLNNPVDSYPDPFITGEDIMNITGIEPSPLLGKIKAALYKAQLEGRFSDRTEGIMFLLHHVVVAEK